MEGIFFKMPYDDLHHRLMLCMYTLGNALGTGTLMTFCSYDHDHYKNEKDRISRKWDYLRIFTLVIDGKMLTMCAVRIYLRPCTNSGGLS